MERQQAVVEITRMLLQARSRQPLESVDFNSLRILLDGIKTFSIKQFKCDYAVIAHYMMIVELVELLKHEAIHGAVLPIYVSTFKYSASIVSIAASLILKRGVNPRRFYFVMEGLRDIFHCLHLTESSFITSDNECDTFLELRNNIVSFTIIGGYSSWSNSSTKLIQLILNTLTANQVNRLSRMLYTILEVVKKMGFDNQECCTFISNTLEWVHRIGTPFSLEHIACQAICRALSGRSVPSASVLGIPKHVQKYLTYY